MSISALASGAAQLPVTTPVKTTIKTPSHLRFPSAPEPHFVIVRVPKHVSDPTFLPSESGCAKAKAKTILVYKYYSIINFNRL